MSEHDFWEETWDDAVVEPEDHSDWVKMMNRRGSVIEVHPARVEAKRKQGWEVCVVQ